MEALTQSLKIGAALAVLVAVAIYAMPERPSLLAGRGEEAAPQVAQAPAPEPVETPAPAPVPATRPEAPASAPAEPTAGQRHLERLRQGAGRPAGSTPPEAAPEASAPLSPPPVATEAPAEMPAEAPEQVPAPASEPPRGLAEITEPVPAPSFRLFRDAAAGAGATIFTEDQTIRIAGVEPPAAGARCAGGSCEEEARAALSDFLSDRSLLCAVDPGAGPSTTAPCVAGEDDVGQWLVSNGWASASPGSRYARDEETARANGIGIWTGD
ncbi:thermonuclease family protein [Aureimonas mangrovi]|uniref:thermonuclease family protein n=1 Tax=Aureimonas mangrovi TaxID=2758041 RepID=UPI00163D95DC|nr:thermonuclease family protein [Aureimonas mangrovi]